MLQSDSYFKNALGVDHDSTLFLLETQKVAPKIFLKSEPLFHHFDLIFAPTNLDFFSWNKRLQTRQRQRLDSYLLLPYKRLEHQKQEQDLLMTDS
jgi:hypothetical protein